MTTRPVSAAAVPVPSLSVPHAVALYVGALLGPSLLLLPGLAARTAGPASVLAWAGLLVLSALIARVFVALAGRAGSGSGVAGYVAAGLGPAAGRITGAVFVAGVIVGAPVVCWIGGGYLADPVGGEATATGTAAAALVLLAVVLLLHVLGARVAGTVQLAVVGVLLLLAGGAAAISLARAPELLPAAHWTPFAPHGAGGLLRAAALLMMAFVGWEAAAPLTERLRSPRRSLPRVVGIAFAVTAALYLLLAIAAVSVLGPDGGGSAPLAALARAAVGPAGGIGAGVLAIVLTLAATQAYLHGARAMTGRPHAVPLAAAGCGVPLLAGAGTGLLPADLLVALPTACFLTVYLLCTAAAVRLLTGFDRAAAAVCCAVVAVLLAGLTTGLLLPAAVTAIAFARIRRAA
ncbi:amino acid permease [Actinocorallia aurea]